MATSQQRWEERGWAVPNPNHCDPLSHDDVFFVHRNYKCYVMFKPLAPYPRREFWLGPYFGRPVDKTYIEDAEPVGPFTTLDEIKESEQIRLHLVNLKMDAYSVEEAG